MKTFENFGSFFETNQKQYKIWLKNYHFQHFYDLTGPKYSKFHEDSESDIKTIHFRAKMIKKHDFMSKFWAFFGKFVGPPFFGHWWGALL